MTWHRFFLGNNCPSLPIITDSLCVNVYVCLNPALAFLPPEHSGPSQACRFKEPLTILYPVEGLDRV